MANANKPIIAKCEVEYAKVFPENRDLPTEEDIAGASGNKLQALRANYDRQGKYSITLVLTPEVEASIISQGFPTDINGHPTIKEKDGKRSLTVKRYHLNPYFTNKEGGKGVVVGGPDVLMTDGSDGFTRWSHADGLIGNGSIAEVVISNYRNTTLTLEAVAVLDHIPYEGGDGGSEGDYTSSFNIVG